ncbi:hypothetical protein M1446_05660 [Candidatus Dependentiae bacterium]|nr:hypothetical protein [Candidatus Dependentiae bacterium]
MASSTLGRHQTTEKILAEEAWLQLNKQELSETDLKNYISAVRASAKLMNADDVAVLNELQQKVKIKIESHKPHINEKYDLESLKHGLICGGITLAFATTAYIIHKKWVQPVNDELDQMKAQLNSIGVTINISYGSETRTTEMSMPPGLTASQRLDAENYFNRLTKPCFYERLADGAVASVGMAACFSGIIGALCIYNWIYPDHKKQYEKMCLIRDKIDESLKIKS